MAHWVGFDGPEDLRGNRQVIIGEWERRFLLVGVVGGLIAVVFSAGLAVFAIVMLLTLGLAWVIGRDE